MIKHLYLGLFAVFSAIHLYFSWVNDRNGRAKTKPFLLIFLLLYYLSSSEKKSLYLSLALLTSWLGDVLLIPKGNKWFVAGGISFIFCHFFFALTYMGQILFARVNWLILIPIAVVLFTNAFMIIKAVKDNTPKSMLPPMYLYLLINSTMNSFAMMQVMSLRSRGAWIACVGALLFYVSDCLLFLVRYHKDKDRIWKKHFLVMLTYLLGEFLITYGMLKIGG